MKKLKKSEILRGAVACLRMKPGESGKKDFICNALRVYQDRLSSNVHDGDVFSIARKIGSIIGISADFYLYKNYGKWTGDEFEEWSSRNYEKIQQWRKAWMLHLADEYEREGD